MSNIDLRRYVVAKWGKWFEKSGNYCADQLRLTALEDGLALAGPLRVRVSVTARNSFTLLGTSAFAECEREAFGYVLDIPPGQTWSYPSTEYLRERLRLERLITRASGATEGASSSQGTAAGASAATNVGIAKTNIAFEKNIAFEEIDALARFEAAGLRLGTNAGFGLLIRLAGPDICTDPCAADPCAVDPCARVGQCSCNCTPCQCQCQGDGLPCNFAQRGGPTLGWYFPSACEPCAPGAVIALPPSTGTALLVPPAAGGTVRTRYFNGMFITREDLETDQRNVRLKRALMNRALGQGVAWGFEVSTDGTAICVLPGYGVDCCGNDVVLASPYRVEVDALVRDPAAAAALATQGPHAMSLVLEYFECPEQPRPVHGDPCSTDVTRCETSRIRETARLRLAPPCPVDDSGCIKDLLTEIEKLQLNTHVAGSSSSQPAASPQPVATPAPVVPFQVQVVVFQTSGGAGTGVSSGPIQPTTLTLVSSDIVFAAASGLAVQITCDFPGGNPNGYTFVSGTPAAVAGSPQITSPTSTASSISWQVPVPNVNTEAQYQLQNWVVQDSSGNTYAAPATQFDLVVSLAPKSQGNEGLNLHIIVDPSKVTVTAPNPSTTNQFPCLTEACSGAKRFIVAPPWLHENPLQPGQAADPRVLALALTYAFIVGEQTRLHSGPASTATSPQLQLGEALYGAVFQATFGTAPQTEKYNLNLLIEKLLQCWCRSLLYPGPKCLCSPHGVVIGCARVESGRITMVDAWGGRRWIVHYPLLAYWGQQFGITPPDVIASRLFDMICCIACLGSVRKANPGVRYGQVSSAGSVAGGQTSTSQSAVLPVGPAMLVFEDAQALSNRLATSGTQLTSTQTITPADFALRLWDAASASLSGTAPAPSQPGSVVAYVPAGFPDVHLLLPAPPSAPTSTSPTAAGSLDSILTSAVTSAPAGSAPPPLLRTFTASLSKRVLAVAPLEPTDNVQHAAADILASAGVTTIADILTRDPETLLKTALKGANADGLNGLITGAEATARTVAADVADTTAKFAMQANVTARSDFADPTRASNLSKVLTDRLATANVAVTPEIVGRAVKLAATAS